MVTHPFGPIESQRIVSWTPKRRPGDISNLKLSAKVIEKRVFESSLHPILLRESGAPTIARLNAEGYGVHFSVEGETNLDARVFPKVTYSISHEGSTVTELDLSNILADGMQGWADENFGQGKEVRAFKILVPGLPKSQQKHMEEDISLIAAKILIPCIGCKRLQIDSTPERLRIMRDGAEELNFSDFLTEERMKILKKYQFFLKLTIPPWARHENESYRNLRETSMLMLSHEAYPSAIILGRILACIGSSDEKWSIKPDFPSPHDIKIFTSAQKLKLREIRDKLHSLIGQSRKEIPLDTLFQLVAALTMLFEPEQVFFCLGLTDESILDKLVAKFTRESQLQLESVKKSDVKPVKPVPQEEPRFGFEIHGTEVKVLEFWRTGEKDTRRFRLKLYEECSGAHTAIRANSLLYMHTGDGDSVFSGSHEVKAMPLMLNLELLATVLTPYTPTAETEAAVAAGEADRLPKMSREQFEYSKLAQDHHQFLAHTNRWFVSPYGGIWCWWYGATHHFCKEEVHHLAGNASSEDNEENEEYLDMEERYLPCEEERVRLSFWHPDDLVPGCIPVDLPDIDCTSKAGVQHTMKMHFCSTGRLAFFGTFGYRDDDPSDAQETAYGYWLFCFEIRKGRPCRQVAMVFGDDAIVGKNPRGANDADVDEDSFRFEDFQIDKDASLGEDTHKKPVDQWITWITQGRHHLCVLGLQSGELHIHLFKKDKFLRILEKKLESFCREYIIIDEMAAKTRLPKSYGNKHTHYTVKISLKF